MLKGLCYQRFELIVRKGYALSKLDVLGENAIFENSWSASSQLCFGTFVIEMVVKDSA